MSSYHGWDSKPNMTLMSNSSYILLATCMISPEDKLICIELQLGEDADKSNSSRHSPHALSYFLSSKRSRASPKLEMDASPWCVESKGVLPYL